MNANDIPNIEVSPLNKFKIHELINFIDFRIGEIKCYTADLEADTLYIMMKNHYELENLLYMLEYFFKKYEKNNNEVKIIIKGVEYETKQNS